MGYNDGFGVEEEVSYAQSQLDEALAKNRKPPTVPYWEGRRGKTEIKMFRNRSWNKMEVRPSCVQQLAMRLRRELEDALYWMSHNWPIKITWVAAGAGAWRKVTKEERQPGCWELGCWENKTRRRCLMNGSSPTFYDESFLSRF